MSASYKRARARAYPPIHDQLEALFDWLAEQNPNTLPSSTRDILERINDVKGRHPKPGQAPGAPGH
ncbi:MAG: hypothetical protein ACPGNT_00910 [Rhodospirillales bacterium]